MELQGGDSKAGRLLWGFGELFAWSFHLGLRFRGLDFRVFRSFRFWGLGQFSGHPGP